MGGTHTRSEEVLHRQRGSGGQTGGQVLPGSPGQQRDRTEEQSLRNHTHTRVWLQLHANKMLPC